MPRFLSLVGQKTEMGGLLIAKDPTALMLFTVFVLSFYSWR